MAYIQHKAAALLALALNYNISCALPVTCG